MFYSNDKDMTDEDRENIKKINEILSEINSFFIVGRMKIKIGPLKVEGKHLQFSVNMSPRNIAYQLALFLESNPKIWDMAEYIANVRDYPYNDEEKKDIEKYKYEKVE